MASWETDLMLENFQRDSNTDSLIQYLYPENQCVKQKTKTELRAILQTTASQETELNQEEEGLLQEA